MTITAEQVLILGSAPDVVRARAWPRAGIDAIVAINNAWAVRPDWDWLIHPSDFPLERRPARLRPGQRLVAARRPTCRRSTPMAASSTSAGRWPSPPPTGRSHALAAADSSRSSAATWSTPAPGASHFYGRGAARPAARRSDAPEPRGQVGALPDPARPRRAAPWSTSRTSRPAGLCSHGRRATGLADLGAAEAHGALRRRC